MLFAHARGPLFWRKKRCIINHRFPFLRGTLGKGKLTSRWHHDSIIIVTPNKILSTCSGNPPRKMEKKNIFKKKTGLGMFCIPFIPFILDFHEIRTRFTSWGEKNQGCLSRKRTEQPYICPVWTHLLGDGDGHVPLDHGVNERSFRGSWHLGQKKVGPQVLAFRRASAASSRCWAGCGLLGMGWP